MGMCCFDVTRSLTVAGRLWSKDANRTKTITADKSADKVPSNGGLANLIGRVKTNAQQTAQQLFAGTPSFAPALVA